MLKIPEEKKDSCIADECVRFLFGQLVRYYHKQSTLCSFVAFVAFFEKTKWVPSYLSKEIEMFLNGSPM